MSKNLNDVAFEKLGALGYDGAYNERMMQFWEEFDPSAGGDVAEQITDAAAKPTPVDADEIGYIDSADAGSLKKLTFANLKAVLLAYFKGQFREKLTAPRTYYVRTDGNDANTGLSNTAGGAFATIQKAVDATAALDVGLHQVTIQVGAGTYAPFALKAYVGAATPLISGNVSAPETVLISATASGVSAVTVNDAGMWNVQGIKVQASGTNGSGFHINGRSTLNIVGAVELGACARRQIMASSSLVQIAANIRVTGGSQLFIESAYPGGFVSFSGGYTCTFVGTPAYSVAAVQASNTAVAIINGITFSGAATGTRFVVTSNAVIQTFGSGATYLPGNSAGAEQTGGRYI